MHLLSKLWHSSVRGHLINKYFFSTSNTFKQINPVKKAILLSSSECHGYLTLQFAREEICHFLVLNNVTDVIFIPYAKNDYDKYTLQVHHAFMPMGFHIVGLHKFKDKQKEALRDAKAVFVGGGNTFLLLKRLYENDMVQLLSCKINEGMVYIGSSAGSNVATKNIHTTNDMPIVYPKSFEGIGIIPFNINPHYINSHEDDETYKGETRDQRILQYLEMPHARPVLGLREGSMLKVHGDSMMIKGVAGAVLFRKNEVRTELPVGTEVSFLCNECNPSSIKANLIK